MTLTMIRNIAATALIAVAVFFVFRFFNPPQVPVEPTRANESTYSESAAQNGLDEIPIERVTDVEPIEPTPQDKSSMAATTEAPTVEYLAVDEAVQDVARGEWNDAEVNRLVDLMVGDPAFAAAIMQEFRSETDPQRLKRLALVLGELDSDELVPLAEEMLYSGNPDSTDAAFFLLNRVQARDPAARDVAMRVLSAESNPSTLVSAINILSRPARLDDQQRNDLVNHITPLISHDDAKVRRRSYATLAKLSPDGSATDILLAGLNDPDPKVRQSITYSFISNVVDAEDVRFSLFSIAENTAETKITRQGAVQALLKQPLTIDEKERVDAVVLQLNQR